MNISKIQKIDRQVLLAKICCEKFTNNSGKKSMNESIANELNIFKNMDTRGLMTDEEYNAAKKEIY